MDVDELKTLNPSIRRGSLPFIGEKIAITLPYRKAQLFTQLQTNPEFKAQQDSELIALNNSKSKRVREAVSTGRISYKVRRGDSLAEIAEAHDVTVAELKKWNHLKGNNIPLGANLKIINNERIVTVVRKEVKGNKPTIDSKTETAVASNETDSDATENPKDYYQVQRGDNLFSIAKKFNVSLEDLKKWNNLNDLNVQQGSKLALANTAEVAKDDETKMETKIVEYKVKKGDNLGSMARKYNVAVTDIKEWNDMEDNNVKLGSSLIVSKKEVAINEPKSSKKEIVAANERDEVKLYYVKKGDSLFSIAKKYPGVTISDIKKWNGIKNESLKPGMKLKING
jgi:membrane-bound lytic murein transglycosylase D